MQGATMKRLNLAVATLVLLSAATAQAGQALTRHGSAIHRWFGIGYGEGYHAQPRCTRCDCADPHRHCCCSAPYSAWSQRQRDDFYLYGAPYVSYGSYGEYGMPPGAIGPEGYYLEGEMIPGGTIEGVTDAVVTPAPTPAPEAAH
jgi:hypothetical protein